MAKKAAVYHNHVLAGILQKADSGNYSFSYDSDYLSDPSNPPISLSIAKTKQVHHSDVLFPYFYGLLAEGSQKELQCRMLKIDENDHFTRLIKTAHADVIGCTTLKEITA